MHPYKDSKTVEDTSARPCQKHTPAGLLEMLVELHYRMYKNVPYYVTLSYFFVNIITIAFSLVTTVKNHFIRLKQNNLSATLDNMPGACCNNTSNNITTTK